MKYRKNNQKEKQELWKYSFKNVGFTESRTKILAISHIHGNLIQSQFSSQDFLFVSAELLSNIKIELDSKACRGPFLDIPEDFSGP